MDVLDKILSASAELFRQYGFKTITMDDIARSAGISKKTLYQHFANKEEVVREAVCWYCGGLAANARQIVAAAPNAVDAMAALMIHMEQLLRQINPMALMELQRHYPEGYRLFREKLLVDDVALMSHIIRDGMNDGLYREELQPELMARFHIEASLMLLLQSNLLGGDRYDLPQVKKEINEHFLYGIMTAKGQKTYLRYKEKHNKQAA